MRRLLVVFAAAAAASAMPHAARPQDAESTAAATQSASPSTRAMQSVFAEADAILRAAATESHSPGAAWGVLADGELAHVTTIGVRDVAARAPVDEDTVFRIASMTKSFTAIAILKLRDEGKLSLDDPAERYVPEMAALRYPTSDAPKITVRHLLSHAEGFPEDNPWGDRQLADTDEQLSAMLAGGIPFSNAPGVAYEYSNLGFAILGRIVSNVSKQPYRDYIAANILEPLAMRSTTLEPRDVAPARLARGYRWEDEQWKDEPLLSNGSFGSMGGMLTTVRDLGRYVAMFLSAWPAHDGPERAPIRRASLREMQQVWRPAPASVARDARGALQLNAGGYGFGLRSSQSCAFPLVVSHGGGLPGFGSFMVWVPDYAIGIVALGNVTYMGWARAANAALEAMVRTASLAPRRPTPAAALVQARDSVSRLVAHWDDRLADSIAAESLFLDRAKDRRRADIERLRASVGECRPDEGGFDAVENALRGRWTIACERGKLQIAITLAPTMPPKVQFMGVRIAPTAQPAEGACTP